MNCVDITLLCVLKKSLSNIYVAFFFKWLERVSASGRTHITLLRHLRNRPKTYTFAVANRNKKTVNHKFVRRKVFIKDFVRHVVNLAVGFVIFVCVLFWTSFQIIRENIFIKWKPKRKRLSKNPLYYTEKNPRFVRLFFKILYTLFTIDSTKEKNTPL